MTLNWVKQEEGWEAIIDDSLVARITYSEHLNSYWWSYGLRRPWSPRYAQGQEATLEAAQDAVSARVEEQ